MEIINFQLQGLACEACTKLASRYLSRLEGVVEVKVGIDGSSEITADRLITRGELEKALSETDYKIV